MKRIDTRRTMNAEADAFPTFHPLKASAACTCQSVAT